MKHLWRSAIIFSLMVILLGCSKGQGLLFSFDSPDHYLSSGSIIISRKLPLNTALNYTPVSPMQQYFAPLIGYIPPSSDLLPAFNEPWLEINATDNLITLYRGNEKVKQYDAEGLCLLDSGVYALQSKQKNPLWYASDGYFARRSLRVPDITDTARFRKGALGEYALFTTTSFAIHGSPVWSEDVGGLKLSREDVAELYENLPLGSTIKVK